MTRRRRHNREGREGQRHVVVGAYPALQKKLKTHYESCLDLFPVSSGEPTDLRNSMKKQGTTSLHPK